MSYIYTCTYFQAQAVIELPDISANAVFSHCAAYRLQLVPKEPLGIKLYVQQINASDFARTIRLLRSSHHPKYSIQLILTSMARSWTRRLATGRITAGAICNLRFLVSIATRIEGGRH